MNSLSSNNKNLSGQGVYSTAPQNIAVNNSIAIPLDSDPYLSLHYPFNGDTLNYASGTGTDAFYTTGSRTYQRL